MTGFVSNKTPEWETYIGSPVVNFSLCAKFVLICSKDCTVRFLDVRNGTPVLPILHMPSPVIQSVFVCNKFNRFDTFFMIPANFLIHVFLFCYCRVSTVNWAVLLPNVVKFVYGI